MGVSTATAGTWARPAWKVSELSQPSERAILCAYLLLCFFSLVPFLAIAQPPIVDFANHAARLTLACNMGDPAIAGMYRYQLGIIPNLAADFVNAPLCGIVEPTMVLRLVTAASLSLIYFSGWLVQRKLFGQANAFLFLLPAFAFNVVTTMGYINFLAGVAIACLMTALAIGREKNFGAMLLIGNLGGLILFFCHVFALAIGMIVFFGLMLGRAPPTPKRLFQTGLVTATSFLLPLSLLLFVQSDGHGFSMGYHEKMRVLIALFMANRSVGLYGIALLGPLLLALKDKDVCLHRHLRLPLAALALYVLLVPTSINDAVDIDARSFVALAFLFFMGLEPARARPGIALATGALSAAFVAFQLWQTVAIWQPFSRQVDEFRKASAVLPAQARVLSVRDFEGPRVIATPMSYFNVTSYATIDRRIFNPMEFTGVGMQPLYVTPAFQAIDEPAGGPFSTEVANRLATPDGEVERLGPTLKTRFALRWPETFDYVVFYHFGRPTNFNPTVLTEVRRGSFFSIFKIRKAS